MEKIEVLKNKTWLANFFFRNKADVVKIQVDFNLLFNKIGKESGNSDLQMAFLISIISAFLKAAKSNNVPKDRLEAALKAITEDLNKT